MSFNSFVRACNDRWRVEWNLADAFLTAVGDRVTARFYDVELATELAPIRLAEAPSLAVAYAARLKSTVAPLSQSVVPVAGPGHAATDAAGIVNFDRLCRTLHLLNFVAMDPDPSIRLILDVDPRHILSVPRDHGAYFAELLDECGMQPEQLVVSTSLEIGAQSGEYLQQIGQGLANYRSRGYQIAVRLEELPMSKASAHFVFKTAPDFLRVDGRGLDRPLRTLPSGGGRYLALLQRLSYSFDGKVLLEHVESEATLRLAREAGIELVQGKVLESPRRARRKARIRSQSASTPEVVYVQAV